MSYMELPNSEEQIRYFLLDLTEEDLKDSVYFQTANFLTMPMDDILDKLILMAQHLEQLYQQLYGEEKITDEDISQIVQEDYSKKSMFYWKIARNCYLWEAIKKRLEEKEEEAPYLAKVYA